MNLDEVVGEVSQGNGRDVIINLFREGISQASEPACSHPHAEVMSFDITGIDMLRVWVAGNSVALTSKAYSGAVALLSTFSDSVDLDQHRVVNIARKRLINRLDVHLQSIAGKLDAIRQTAGKVFDKVAGTLGVALADQPARHSRGRACRSASTAPVWYRHQSRPRATHRPRRGSSQRYRASRSFAWHSKTTSTHRPASVRTGGSETRGSDIRRKRFRLRRPAA